MLDFGEEKSDIYNKKLERIYIMHLQKNFPSVAKYMGSKTDVLDLIEKGINDFEYEHEWICDLFAGSSTLSGALRNKANIISNDIQKYSEVFANTYLNNYEWDKYPSVLEITKRVSERVVRFMEYYPYYSKKFNYNREFTLEEFNQMEEEERELIKDTTWESFDNYFLFTQNYSGTYWSFEQCVWIDSYRAVIDDYKSDAPFFNLLLTCLIYAMAYNSQSTGHYAQYRIPETDSSKEDILIYRRKNIADFFIRKYEELKEFLKETNEYQFTTMANTDRECLNCIPEKTLVYADPPYCFVHYSRFYHIMETVVRYDYPKVRYKGRYRTDRYQSEYCIKTQVEDAFSHMFEGIRTKKSDMILSYTNSETNTINFSKLLKISCDIFNPNKITDEILENSLRKSKLFFENGELEKAVVLSKDDVDDSLDYEIVMIKKPYNHSRMGRTQTKTIPVTEVVIIAKRCN